MSSSTVQEASQHAQAETSSRNAKSNKPKRKRGEALPVPEENPLCRALTLLDPLLQFLTRATGHAMVPLKSLLSAVPNARLSLEDVLALVDHGVLQLDPKATRDKLEMLITQ